MTGTAAGRPGLPLLLLVDDDPIIAETLGFLLGREFDVRVAGSREQARQVLAGLGETPALALVDLGLPPLPHEPGEGLALVSELLAMFPAIKILVLSGQSARHNARRALALGAVDFVVKPCEPDHLMDLLRNALALARAEAQADDDGIVGSEQAMVRLRQQIRQYAPSPFPVLVEGESGSGKELVARSLHRQGPRAAGPYLAVNCAALAPTLVEATLFGVARGAYTGAATTREGYFGEARGGTLFLDEIGELAPETQAKLLRVLENGEFQRVGETQVRRTDARVIAATNRDLREEMRAGAFRADLYHRLGVFTVTVPPLRTLGPDRMRLAAHFSDFYARQCGVAPVRLDAEARALWLEYPFPGNVRELRNIIIRLTTKYPGDLVDRARLAEELAPPPPAADAGAGAAGLYERARATLRSGSRFSLDEELVRVERAYVDAALEVSGGNLAQAARLLGLQRTTLYGRLQQLRRSTGTPGED